MLIPQIYFWFQHTAETVDQTAEMKEAFKIFDRDGDGYIDFKELKQVVTRMGEPLSSQDADELFREADINGDGKLDFNEFVRMITETWSKQILFKKTTKCGS